jgi:formate hydrogenlyase subunit 3/multisubunit Na+/H+ antiporter MnhD subunit
MPYALWLVGLPIGAATVVFLLRRFWAGALIAAVITVLLAWLAISIPADVVLNVLGRTVELDPFSQVVLFLLFSTTAILFVVLIILTGQQTATTTQPFLADTYQAGRVFYPAALVTLSFFVAASLSRHLGVTAILVEVAAIIMVFVIQTERLESTRAALRFLVLASLATPLFLLAAWQVDDVQLSDRIIAGQTVEWVALLAGGGFAIWLAIIPFHSWITSTAAEALPPTAAFVLIAFPAVAILTLVHLLGDWPWLTNASFLIRSVILAGAFTAFVAGLLAGMQRGFSELMGYAALYNLSFIVSLLGVGGDETVLGILFSLVVRSLALILIAVSMSTIKLQTAQVGFAQVRGVVYQMPVATLALILGGVTLAGMPFTAGFAPYWQLLRSLAAIQWWGVVLLAAGSLGVTVGYLRGLYATLSVAGDGEVPNSNSRNGVQMREPLLLVVIMVILMISIVVLGIYPTILINLLQPFVTELTLPAW